MSNKDEQDIDRNAALAMLTDEERAAIEDDEQTPDEKAAIESIAGGDDDDDDGNEGDDDLNDDASAAAPVEGQGAAPATAQDGIAGDGDAGELAPGSEDVEPVAEAQFKPRYQVELPADFDAQVAALDSLEVDLAERFKAGDMESEVFLAEQRDIGSKRAALMSLRNKSETFAEMNQQSAAQEWQWSVQRFIAKVKKAGGTDYVQDAEKAADFDGFVKALAGNPKNSDKDYAWFLAEAHKRTNALHGVPDRKPVGASPDAKPPAEGKPAPRKAPVDKLPATLAQVPGGDGPGDVSDEFADLDKLDGLEYEQALAKMTLAQRERYLAAA